MNRKVYLDGELGDRYGKELTMNVDSIGEVFRCLDANYPGVRSHLLDCHERNIGFLCEVGGSPIESELELSLAFPEGSFYISPQPVGAKSAGLKIIIGIALVAAAFAFPILMPTVGQAGLLTGGTFASFAQLTVMGIGVNLALSGVMQIMAPDPSTDGAEQDDAYLFQGSGQTILEGDPIPVLYGKLRVPGRPISFEVKNQYQTIRNDRSYGGVTPPSDDTDLPTQEEEFEYLPPPGEQDTNGNPTTPPGGGGGGGAANKESDLLITRNHD